MDEDRRGAYRRNAFTFGTVLLDAGEAIACLVWDATEGGAQIEVEDPALVPGHFLLRQTEDTPARPATVAWRRGQRIGVRFMG